MRQRQNDDLVAGDLIRDRKRKTVEYCHAPVSSALPLPCSSKDKLERGFELILELRAQPGVSRLVVVDHVVDLGDQADGCAASSSSAGGPARPDVRSILVQRHGLGSPSVDLGTAALDLRFPSSSCIVVGLTIEATEKLQSESRSFLDRKPKVAQDI